jgi:FkbM family methyltransferase
LSDYDTNFAGPANLAPKIHRSQEEKDTWYSIVVENEYKIHDLEPHDVVVDIGANIGSFVFKAYKEGSRRIFAFEPSKHYVEAAFQNVGDLEGVHLYNYAVVRGDQHRKPQYFHDGQMSTFVDKGDEVSSVSLDEILSEIGHVRVLKIDCEGGEWPILYTCQSLHLIDQIVGEYHMGQESFKENLDLPTHTGGLVHFLYEQGFTNIHILATAPKNLTGNFFASR